MKKYLVKTISDSGAIVGYEIKQKTNANHLPRGNNFIFIEGVDTKYPKLNIKADQSLEIIEDTALKNKADTKKAFEDKVNLKIERQDFGKRLIAMVDISNDDKNLSVAQRVQFAKDFEDINRAMINGSIDSVQSLVTVMNPDGIVITEEDKNAILKEITDNLVRLGYGP